MFKFLKNLSGKAKKIMLSVGTGVVAASAMAIAACAEGAEGAGGSATTLDISTIVNSAGSTLQTQFVALVQAQGELGRIAGGDLVQGVDHTPLVLPLQHGAH